MSTLEERVRRREQARRRLRVQRIGAAGVLGSGALVALSFAFSSHGQGSRSASAGGAGPSAGQSATSPARGGPAPGVLAAARIAGPIRLSERRIGKLPAPLEDPGASLAGARVVLAGGLTAQDTSTAAVIVCTATRRRPAVPCPGQHDAPAAALGGSVYVFGGGDGFASSTTSCESTRARGV